MRPFEILDKLNQADEKDGTKKLAMSVTMTNAQTCKQGALITMGVDAESFLNIMDGTHHCVLLVYDKAAYKEAEKEVKS